MHPLQENQTQWITFFVLITWKLDVSLFQDFEYSNTSIFTKKNVQASSCTFQLWFCYMNVASLYRVLGKWMHSLQNVIVQARFCMYMYSVVLVYSLNHFFLYFMIQISDTNLYISLRLFIWFISLLANFFLTFDIFSIVLLPTKEN